MSDSSNILPALEPIPDEWKDLSKKSRDGKNDVAFALGGLGGFNNYLGGFLASAIKSKCYPSLISCTSGGIAWAAEYLRASKADPEAGIEYLENCAKQANQQSNLLPSNFRLLNDEILGLTGIHGIFRPQWEKTVPNFFLHPSSPDLLRWPPSEIAWANEFADRVMPAAWATPTRPDQWFLDCAEIFNESKIGIVFNAFDPQDGTEFLFINKAAAPWLNIDSDKDKSVPNWRRFHRASNRLKHWKINDTAIRAALQLFAYGFDWRINDPDANKTRTLVDGAYHRQLILTELHKFEKIFAVRPLNEKYQAHLPTNYLDTLNLQTQMWLNGAVNAQMEAIELVNALIKGNQGVNLKISNRPIHEITIVPVEIETDYGFFDYFIETMETYEKGLEAGLNKL